MGANKTRGTSATAVNNSKYILGQAAEMMACKYLISRGLKFICKNYRCKTGEIDLVMQHDQHLVFIEVRFRGEKAYGSSLESVTKTKQRRIINTAKHYLQRYKLTNQTECRFDVIGIDAKTKINWIQDAFQVNEWC